MQTSTPGLPQTSRRLGNLRSLFDGGVVTAGNASGINDGAAALVIGNREVGEKFGVKPRVRIIAGAVAGVEPRVMGLGPVFAIQKALARANLTLADMDVIEINEAFATQVLGCLKMLDVDFTDSRVNPNGGAIAIGHPLGASGARIALTTMRHLERTGGRYAAISLCNRHWAGRRSDYRALRLGHSAGSLWAGKVAKRRTKYRIK